jgi:glycosyltransferase involved in cell wall biosynthesis
MPVEAKLSTPSVSVIIPTHNRAHFLPTALRSVLNQTFQDLEIMVVDDASTDGTPGLRQQYQDPRIHWLRHDSIRGGGAARNAGIANTRGEYIAFLDDDDEWYPEKLARQIEVMRKRPAEVAAVYTGYLVVDRATGQVRGRMIPRLRGNLHADLLKSNPIGGTSSVLLRRTCLDRVGLFDETLPSFQDRDLWIRIAREFHFDYVDQPLLNSFSHPKKVWTNLDALIKGLEIMLEKYGSSPAFRKQCGARYLWFGLRLCEAGQIGRGRQALLKSIALSPYGIKPYLYFLLTLLGSNAFTMARHTMARVHGEPLPPLTDSRFHCSGHSGEMGRAPEDPLGP